MPEITEDRLRQIFQEEIAAFFSRGDPKSSDAPPCPYCKSEETYWRGRGWKGKGRRLMCRRCGRTKTIKPGDASNEETSPDLQAECNYSKQNRNL